MLTALVENTNLYSMQKDGRSVEIDVKKVEKVIGIYLHMGIVKMPTLQATVTRSVRSAQCSCASTTNETASKPTARNCTTI